MEVGRPHTLGMENVIRPFPGREPRGSTPHVDSIVAAVLALLGPLSISEKQAVVQRITDAVLPIPARNAGEVLEAVILALPTKGQVTVEELKVALDNSGIGAKPKEIYNAVGYLTRKGHIQRMGYGRYLVNGVAIETPEDIGPDLRNEESYIET